MSIPFTGAKPALGKIHLSISRLTISHEPVLPILLCGDRHRLFTPTCDALHLPSRHCLSWQSPTTRTSLSSSPEISFPHCFRVAS